jgi:two-component system, OmpR family, sensor histidine kinase KdpD
MIRRRTPEELLREVEAEESAHTRGRLKIFLGYASGVGKSFRMLDEARRRRERGEDVVVAAIQPRVPEDVQDILDRIPQVRTIGSADSASIDVAALLGRHPAVCVIDGLAYDNPPGSRNPTRWQDAGELLAAGVGVIASVNIQYVSELRQQVEAITGKHVNETVPAGFLRRADEIELVDAPASASLPRAAELRELALLLAADVVDHQLSEYLKAHGMERQTATQERIMVCVTPRTNFTDMLATAVAIRDRFHGELLAASVRQPGLAAPEQAALDEKLAAAARAGATVEILDGEDPVKLILDFARERGITQLFIGHSQRRGLWARLWGNPVEKLIRRSGGIEVRVFPQ